MINCTMWISGVTACDQTDQEPVKQPEETRRKYPYTPQQGCLRSALVPNR